MAPSLTRPDAWRLGRRLGRGLGPARAVPPCRISPDLFSSGLIRVGRKLGVESPPPGHTAGLVLGFGPSPTRDLWAMESHNRTLNRTDPGGDLQH